jgi:hypothetical protein
MDPGPIYTTISGNLGTVTEGGDALTYSGLTAGYGGDLGQAGQDITSYDYNGNSHTWEGGEPGIAIDGVSYCTFTVTGTILGTQTN